MTFLEIILYLILLLAAGAGVVVLVGHFVLPATGYNGYAMVTTSRATPETVRRQLETFKFNVTGDLCKQREDLPPAKEEGSGLPRWREDMGPSSVTVSVTKNEPGMIALELADSVVPMTAVWTIESSAGEKGGTKVKVSQSMRINNGTWHVPFFRVLIKATGNVVAGPRAMLVTLLTQLAEEETIDQIRSVVA